MNLELPYLLRKENICHYDGNKFYIGNRKLFPYQKTFVCCNDVKEISNSIKSMITQGGGPLQVGLTTICYLVDLVKEGTLPFNYNTFSSNIDLIINSRPTNTTMKRTLNSLLNKYKIAIKKLNKEEFLEFVINTVKETEEEFDSVYHKMATLGSQLIKDGDTILTTCFAEHTLLLAIYYAKKQGKQVHVLVNETRPYLQGARLTAPSLTELGIKVEIISDGMGAFFMRNREIDHYMTASDLVCMDGTVVNKVGTLSNAIAANYYGIPYTAFSMSPDISKNGIEDIEMEMRNGNELLSIFNHNISEEGIGARYPSFDIVEPSLVTNIVTNKGVYKPSEIKGAFIK